MTKKKKNRGQMRPRVGSCRAPLAVGLVLAVIYAVVMMGMTALNWSVPTWAVAGVWALAQAVLGVGVLCLYRRQRAARWGAVGAVLLLSAWMSLSPTSAFLAQALQALALTGFSLVLYDVDKLTGVPLRLPGGLIFLAVIGSLLGSPLMAFVGLAFLALGSALALTRL